MKLINTDCLADDGIPSLEENSIDMIFIPTKLDINFK